MKVYLIQFVDGSWAKGGSYRRSKDITQSKVYPSLRRANQAMSFHSHFKRDGAKVVAFEMTQTELEDEPTSAA